MNIFDKIPENFFSILVSKNKNIYIDALFVLAEAFKQEMLISKDNIISRLINNLEDELNQEDFSEEDEQKELKDDNVSGKAYFLLRKLKWAGWIELEMQKDSFEEYIILPDYSIKFINLLYSLTEETQTEYNSCVYVTYTSLKVASDKKEETYNAIIAAYKNTMELIDELKSLYNSLGRFHRKLSSKENINDVTSEHFINYKSYSDEMIFPRFTRDSVPRYKEPIKELLNNILADRELLQNTINIACSRAKYNSPEEAENDILTKIRTILEVYENIDVTMNQISDKNTDYVKASIQRMQYLLTSDKELKGKLVGILRNSKNDEVVEKMVEETNLYRQEYVSKESLYIRNPNDKRKDGKAMPLMEELDTEADSEKYSKEFVKTLEKMYTPKRINKFMEDNFQDKPFVNSSEITLNNTEDLILLILATVKADNSNKCFYYIEEGNETIVNNGYKIPNIKFIRRKANA